MSSTRSAAAQGTSSPNSACHSSALQRGAGIGLHQHDHDEIYYVVSATGVYTPDGKEHAVGPGNAMLTRPGSTPTPSAKPAMKTWFC